MTLSPLRRRLGWYLNVHRDRSIRQEQVIAFLRQLLRHLRGEMFLIWDRLNAHRGNKVASFLSRHPRVHVEFLPPYAPELNANEYAWGHLKCHSLANYCPEDLDELEATTNKTVKHSKTRQNLLRGFLKATGLPLRLRA